MRRFAPVLLYLAVLSVAVWLADGWMFRITFALGPILLLDQYVFRLLPWQPPVPSALSLLPRLGLVVVLAGVIYAFFRPIYQLTETLYMSLALCVGLSLIASIMELAGALIQRGRKDAKPGSSVLGAVVIALGIILVGIGIQPLLTFHPFHSAVLVTPADYNVPFEKVTVTAADGLPLAAWFIPCPDATGSAIFCHGYCANRSQVMNVVPLLQEHKLNIIAFDFRGHGESPGRTAAFGAREYLDVMGAENYLKERVPGKPILLFGISYGAAVAVQSLPHLKEVRAAWIESGFARLGDLAVHKFGMVPESIRGPVVGFYNGVVWLDSGFAPLDVKPIDCLKDVKVPICFCHGTKDELVFFREGPEMYEAYQGPKESYWVQGEGHGALVIVGGEEYKQRFANFVKQYLK
jgi:pimeloyl-ACP methyl ester carboxylesterase